MLMRACAYLVAAGSMLAAGCSPLTRLSSASPAMVHTLIAQAGIVDRRAPFRAQFCQLLAHQADPAMRDCGQWLQRFADEASGAAPAPPPPSPLAPTLNIVIVSGIFSECIPDVVAFADATQQLQEAGYDISRAPIKGRASSELNAAIIRDHLVERGRAAPGRPFLIVGYSKGIADTITALATYPELADSVAAVLSVAGVVNGSPAADKLEALYNATLAHLPHQACPIQDAGEMHSLTRSERLAWLAQHRLPTKPLYFTLIGVADPARVSTVFKPFYRALSAVEPRNDGQMLYYDAVLPNSRLLGYVNADHFAIALPFISAAPRYVKAGIDQNGFPRDAMLEAAVRIVEKELRGHDSTR